MNLISKFLLSVQRLWKNQDICICVVNSILPLIGHKRDISTRSISWDISANKFVYMIRLIDYLYCLGIKNLTNKSVYTLRNWPNKCRQPKKRRLPQNEDDLVNRYNPKKLTPKWRKLRLFWKLPIKRWSHTAVVYVALRNLNFFLFQYISNLEYKQ